MMNKKRIISFVMAFLLLFAASTTISGVKVYASMDTDAKEISFGESVSGKTNYNRHNYYKITLSQSEYVEFDMKCEFNDGKSMSYNQGVPLVDVMIYDSTGKEIFNSSSVTFTNNKVTGYCSAKKYLNLKSGTYYVDADEYDEWLYEFMFLHHSHNKTVSVKPATVLTTGEKTTICSECGYIFEKRTINKLKPTIKLSANKKKLKKGKSFVLSISKLGKGDYIEKVSLNKKCVVSVKKSANNKYKVVAKKKGKVNVSVCLKSGKKAKCVVSVK